MIPLWTGRHDFPPLRRNPVSINQIPSSAKKLPNCIQNPALEPALRRGVEKEVTWQLNHKFYPQFLRAFVRGFPFKLIGRFNSKQPAPKHDQRAPPHALDPRFRKCRFRFRTLRPRI